MQAAPVAEGVGADGAPALIWPPLVAVLAAERPFVTYVYRGLFSLLCALLSPAHNFAPADARGKVRTRRPAAIRMHSRPGQERGGSQLRAAQIHLFSNAATPSDAHSLRHLAVHNGSRLLTVHLASVDRQPLPAGLPRNVDADRCSPPLSLRPICA